MFSQEDALFFGYPHGVAFLPVICHPENLNDGLLQLDNHFQGLISYVLGTYSGLQALANKSDIIMLLFNFTLMENLSQKLAKENLPVKLEGPGHI